MKRKEKRKIKEATKKEHHPLTAALFSQTQSAV
jgi:hypothetical protein